MLREEVQCRCNTTASELDVGQPESHLTTGESRHQSQVVAVAQMADAEHPAANFSKSLSQRQIEALVDELSDRVSVYSNGHHHTRQHRAVGRRIGTLNLQAPSTHCEASRLAV